MTYYYTFTYRDRNRFLQTEHKAFNNAIDAIMYAGKLADQKLTKVNLELDGRLFEVHPL